MVKLDPKINVGLTTMVPGAKAFKQYREKIDLSDMKEINIFETHGIPPDDNDEDLSFQQKNPVEEPREDEQSSMLQHEMPQTTTLNLSEIKTHVIPEDKDPTTMDAICPSQGKKDD